MPAAHDLIAGAVVTLLFLAIVATAEAWKRWGHPDPEWTRKLIHIAGGLVALNLPLVIESHWVVLVMSLGMALLFLGGKLAGKLQSLHGVERKSNGTEYYPLVIYLLFVFTHGEPWKYFICVLVLTTADALAALVGSRYGRLRYEVDHNYKSVEGSLAFLVATFLAVLVPLLMWPQPHPPSPMAAALTALLVAILTMGFEAIAQDGRDNLWVPLGTLLILNRVLPLPEPELAERLIVLLVVCLVTALAVWRTATFNVGGTIVLILAAYLCWTLTSLDWALPVFLAFAFYVVAMLASPHPLVIASKPVVKGLLLPFIVMMCAYTVRQFDGEEGYAFLFGPFLTACIVIAALAVWDQVLRERQLSAKTKCGGALAVAVVAVLVVAVPAMLMQKPAPLLAFAGVAIAALAICLPAGLTCDHAVLQASARWWWCARIGGIVTSMGLVALAQAVELIPVWHPR